MRKKKILIVDDEFFITRSLSRLLAHEGYACLVSNDGYSALQIARSERPDLIFLDIDMPGKNGYDVLKEIREQPDLNNVFIAILSAMGLDINKEKVMNLGANKFIDKPFDPLKIIKMVEEVLL